jgi:hypothetical protein
MNKMIQRQDIVPPWIEKQQELVKAANVFRARLRNDWKRHAARTIASRGGSLQDQMRTADLYAEAERVHNPKKRTVEQISVPTNATDDPVMVKIIQEPAAPDQTASIQVSVGNKNADITISDSSDSIAAEPSSEVSQVPTDRYSVESLAGERDVEASESSITSNPPRIPLPAPFRTPSWEAAEASYLQLAVTNLNNLTRSYNLMAPDLAKKPYFSLERELKACYADIAPVLAQEIKERAARPPRELVEKIGHRPGSVLERFGKDTAKIYDSKKPLYGFKDFWNDLFGEKRA